MALLHKLSMAAVTSAAAFLALGSFGTDPAQAALFKYSFEGEGVNGYFIYETETTPDPQYDSTPNSDLYPGAVVEYKVDLGEKGVFQGSTGDANVFFARSDLDSNIPPENESDIFELEIKGSDREPESEYTFLADFYYPKDSLGGSTELPTSVPSTARVDVRPNALATDRGASLFDGTVQTRVEKVPESTSSVALLGVGAWFILRRRQRRQTHSISQNSVTVFANNL
ncbi:PEP-CTERM sorting domain-containing protein [Mastigocladopsis repens]|uniref:PEP-CTERM sorting domain-containing protein n=1 Tax=Mastigocladopsis repens TaxID=221287 RepID=UPI00036D623B|nr:PEP-CTERM sorting domain-containing protein [Mastigocladopsis repens]